MLGPDLPRWRKAAELTGRRAECAVLDQLVKQVRSGESHALVIHGEAGVGKTALLEYLTAQARGLHVVHAWGVQSEMELAFATLHQLCAPELGSTQRLPAPQAEALRTALGLSVGSRPDLFMVGLGVLGLLSDVAERQPLLLLIDDQQWLDRASAQVLGFVARRLGAESIGLVFAVRETTQELTGLPTLAVPGLREPDAAALLDSIVAGPLDPRVRAQIIAESRGNPLALLQVQRTLAPTQLAGGFELPSPAPTAAGMEDRFSQWARTLPETTRMLLLLAAADPSGDAALLWRAAASLGIGAEAADPAVEAGLAEFGSRATFRHPLVRSAVYRSAASGQRRRAHRALAEATDAHLDPDRRAWHRSQAVVGPDAEVAEELEHSARRAQARGGLAAAGAFLKRAAALTLDPAHRAQRALLAAHAELQAGGFDAARDLLDMADSPALGEAQRANLAMLQAMRAFLTNRGNDAPLLLVEAARRLETLDPALSRATYLDALMAAIFAGRLATPGGDVLDVAAAAAKAPAATERRAPDYMLEGTAALYNDGYTGAVPPMRSAVATFGEGMSDAEELRLLYMAGITALRLWDVDGWKALATRHVDLARRTGAVSELHLALTSRSYLHLFAGELATAAAAAAEVQAFMDASGTSLAPYVALGVAAFRGDAAGAPGLIARTIEDVTRRGEGIGVTFALWAQAVLNNGLGRYEEAREAAQQSASYEPDRAALVWLLPELIEAAARSGDAKVAQKAWVVLTEMTTASGTDWALGIQNRCQALLADDEGDDSRVEEGAECLHHRAIGYLERTSMRVDLARAHLLYGEWLRRVRRRSDARQHLQKSYGMFEEFGMAGFADRAGRELRAAGGTTHSRQAPSVHADLTAQEAQIARMACDGLTNPEIAERLFISAHTVRYHLHKVFTKLDIGSRSQLDAALGQEPRN